mmetsp:Transcript_15985/g.19452  ORF Transcript_15985/g.19452 Transcript_15985/m.19452 type:complete len:91 (-) Transcript_15985:278-550(-)
MDPSTDLPSRVSIAWPSTDRLNRMQQTTNAPKMSTDALTLFVTSYAPSSNPPTQPPTTKTATTTTILNTNPPKIITVLSIDVTTNLNDPL